MSTGIWARLDDLFHQAMHHNDLVLRRKIAMSAYTHLKACIDAGNAKIVDLEKQLADARAQPAGTADTDLETLASSIETALGATVADPDAGTQTGTDPTAAV
jgi:hypothetical protein